jgi:hypothetical protein
MNATIRGLVVSAAAVGAFATMGLTMPERHAVQPAGDATQDIVVAQSELHQGPDGRLWLFGTLTNTADHAYDGASIAFLVIDRGRGATKKVVEVGHNLGEVPAGAHRAFKLEIPDKFLTAFEAGSLTFVLRGIDIP